MYKRQVRGLGLEMGLGLVRRLGLEMGLGLVRGLGLGLEKLGWNPFQVGLE